MQDDRLLAALKSRFQDRDTTNFDVFDFLYAEGSPLLLLWYSTLLWPEFTEINGMIFLRSEVDTADGRDRVERTFKKLGGNRLETERSFNTILVEDLFDPKNNDLDFEQYKVLVARVAEIWTCRLRLAYPDRQFTYEIIDATNADSLGFVFYQSQSGPLHNGSEDESP